MRVTDGTIKQTFTTTMTEASRQIQLKKKKKRLDSLHEHKTVTSHYMAQL